MRNIEWTPELGAYLFQHNPLALDILDKVAKETSGMPGAQMQIGQDQGALMHQLVKLCRAKRIVELGCFTGYSAISMASALPEGGLLVTCDSDAEIVRKASAYFEEAGLAQKITTMVGQALDSLDKLLETYGESSFDMAFIDADKKNYQNYYEKCLKLITPGGLILVDNVLWSGKVCQFHVQDPMTQAIRDFNEYLRRDERVEKNLVNIGDGLFMIRKL